jgi:putative oxidoreductase
MGAAFLFHGEPKIQNAFHWMDGREAPSPVPPFLQAAAAVSEFVGGMALIVGLLTPLAALGIACTMATALFMVHLPQWDPFVGRPGQRSFELAAIYLASAILLLLIGPGVLSIDALLFGRRSPLSAAPLNQPAPKVH